jgi:hypothetical protein
MGNNFPSAGLTSLLSPAGGVRSGSRKNAMHQIVSGRNASAGHGESQYSKAFTTAKIAMNGQPSRWMGLLSAVSPAHLS